MKTLTQTPEYSLASLPQPRSELDGFKFSLPPELQAHEPPEARGLARDGVRMMVSYRTDDRVLHARFSDLPRFLSVEDDEGNPGSDRRRRVPVVARGRDLEPGVVIVDGDDIVGVDLTGSALTTGTVASSRREQHTVKLALTVVAFRVTEDVGETLSRAWGLLALVDQHVRSTDPTLGGAVLWARVTSTDAGSAPRKASGGYSGRVSMVEATVECGVIAAVG